ncbi:MAG: twin-arginine translocase TatA/TatE family subunit [Alphaproteobacteria bacterium]|nr:twin-arginine translocase TatA/TatE family subunit [Alphaproteobacteria bacterium]MCZ6511016.1 twin-arginine translocase TatA/TatE family subunit [Alphaproteobacteria bacterium]MCZ6588485.1 twin-arginine translocase TatA/TatE family subunit [Alphaproteobacteria bacterium]MCZ6592138.1 twin-arginine translocase TatA/TatE family subunit [Alphaproteobacteria bacterium]MCZ6838832.1 twin-arginine translocase TatA/TatE family subunit [Alphaproteobacteria bacterium]
MGTFSIWHWLIVLVVVLVLFGGRGKIPTLMGDIAKGIKSFKSNMKDQSEDSADSKKIEAENVAEATAVQDEQTAAKN